MLKIEFILIEIIKFKLNFKNIVFKDLIYGEIWFKLFEEVKMLYVFFVLDIIYFIDDVNFECFVCMLSEV